MTRVIKLQKFQVSISNEGVMELSEPCPTEGCILGSGKNHEVTSRMDRVLRILINSDLKGVGEKEWFLDEHGQIHARLNPRWYLRGTQK